MSETTVGVVAESGVDERRVALVPKAIAPLVKSGGRRGTARHLNGPSLFSH